jgi:hypothetical protein
MSKQPKRKQESSALDSAAPAAEAGHSTAAATLDRDRVAQRAYELYLARGGGEGQELEDWLSAEREVKAGTL